VLPSFFMCIYVLFVIVFIISWFGMPVDFCFAYSSTYQFPTFCCNKMADIRTCDVEATLALLNRVLK
jgi:maltodextrin utilization protein YvdJ